MPIERAGLIKLGTQDATILGDDVLAGMDAPEFTVQDNRWKSVNGLESTAGKVRIIAAVPSLSTAVCDRETRAFNQHAAALGGDVAILVISTDLPPTQKNWCGAAGVDRVQTLSDATFADFGVKYGALMKERRWLRRAVWVIDRAGKVVYADYMQVLSEEPKYDEVLAAAQAALA